MHNQEGLWLEAAQAMALLAGVDVLPLLSELVVSVKEVEVLDGGSDWSH